MSSISWQFGGFLIHQAYKVPGNAIIKSRILLDYYLLTYTSSMQFILSLASCYYWNKEMREEFDLTKIK